MGFPRRITEHKRVCLNVRDQQEDDYEPEEMAAASERCTVERVWMHHRSDGRIDQGTLRCDDGSDEWNDRCVIGVYSAVEGIYVEYNAGNGRQQVPCTGQK